MTCSTGDKPIITYKFGNGNNRIYKSDFSPIEIISKAAPVISGENFNNDGYQLQVRSLQYSGGAGDIIVKDYMTFYQGNILYFTAIYCGQTDYPRNQDGSLGALIALNNGNPAITRNPDPAVKCPGIPPLPRCSLQIMHNGQLLFQDQGECPVVYDVQCTKCPEGTCECPTPNYPGYCCLDCASTAASIRAITNNLRAKNG